MSITTGVGIAGGLGLHQLLASGSPRAAAGAYTQRPAVTPGSAPAPAGLSLDGITLAGPMVLHVRDVPSGEISMMVGTQELIYRDPQLVSQLVKTAASVNKRAEG
jgi:hypothetical protein